MIAAPTLPDIRLLMVEDNLGDAELELRQLKRAGLMVTHRLVETAEGLAGALRDFTPDVVVSDFSMPLFDGLSALRMVRELAPDTPFLFVSGTLGEDHAIRALKEGATDYVLKGDLARFPSAVERALAEAKERKERRVAQAGLGRAQTMAKLAHIVTRAGGAFERWSENLPSLIGADAASMPGSIREWMKMVHPDDRAMFRAKPLEANATGKRVDLDYRLCRGDGKWVHLRQVIEPLSASAGVAEWFSTIQDVSEQKRAEEKIGRLSRLYHVMSETNSAIFRVRERAEVYREACRIAVDVGMFKLAWIGLVDEAAGSIAVAASRGATPAYIAAMPVRLDAAPGSEGLGARAVREKRPMIANDIANDARIQLRQQALENGLRSLVILPLIVSGRACAVLALYSDAVGFFDQEEMKSLLDLAGDLSFALEHIDKQEQLDYLAYFDPLTGLANSSLFRERLSQQVAAERGKLAVLILDVYRFKSVNDTLGRQAGDQLLKELARRVVAAAQDAGRVARIGADHFAMLVPGVPGEDEAARIAEHRLDECFGAPYRLGEAELHLSGKVGIAMYPGDGGDADTLLTNAEAALKKAKAGGEKHLFYTQRMSERTAEVLGLESRLRQALERSEFVLHYQPKVDLLTREIVAVEALMRWQSPERGLVPPVSFIPLLEESGLILEVGVWALKQAARDHRSWVERGLAAPRIAVNVSAIQLRQRNFVARLQGALVLGAKAPGVDLEITESLIMTDIQGTIETLKKVRELGVTIAIDDFGTGYSSLAYLSRLPVSTLKIDRSFVNGMLKEADATSIVQTIIGLAHSMRLQVVAEGVETEAQATLLRLLRCDQMQGYLFSKPVPLPALEALLDRAATPAEAGR
jgi:diguanylate cyclase (GGDEF)-like protein/PAS domain S-box-containing protein